MQSKWFSSNLERVLRSAVAWSSVFTLLRIGSGLLLLPLLFKSLSREELGVYYMFLAVAQFTVVIDFGFSGTISRFVSYAMSGARSLTPHGVSEAGEGGEPNLKLVWELLFTTRMLYRLLAGSSLVLLALVGTPFMLEPIGETANPSFAWVAFGLSVLGAATELYSSWWNVFLASMNKVASSNRILVFVYFTKFSLSCLLLLFGVGLGSVPIAALAASVLQRTLSRRACLLALSGNEPENARVRWREHLRVLWPNSWRLGLQISSGFAANSLRVLICGPALGAVATAELGFSLQVINIIQSVSGVWVNVKWPLIGQLRARKDVQRLQEVLWPRVWLQTLFYILGACFVIFIGPLALDWLGTDKTMVDQSWMILIALNGFFEGQFFTWSTLIATENRLPYLWPAVAANTGRLLLAVVLLYTTPLGVGSFIIAPLLSGLIFNYWHWPLEGARSINASLGQFLFTRPQRS
jgi:O-antigen/teichoic acid export membrane protein